MSFHPPAAEGYLYYEYQQSERNTQGIAEIKVQSPMVEKERAYDALSDIVGQAHPAIWHDIAQGTLQTCGIEGEKQACNYHRHEAELMERRYYQHQRVHERT